VKDDCACRPGVRALASLVRSRDARQTSVNATRREEPVTDRTAEPATESAALRESLERIYQLAEHAPVAVAERTVADIQHEAKRALGYLPTSVSLNGSWPRRWSRPQRTSPSRRSYRAA
jgi:hypothetical protein